MSNMELYNYEDEFDKIWDIVIKNMIVSFSNKYNVKHKSLNSLRKRIKANYNKQRDYFINSFMDKSVNNIDRHKIASCCIKSILICKPFYVPFSIKRKFLFSNENISDFFDMKLDESNDKISTTDKNNYIFYINEYLSLAVASAIIDGYIYADQNKELKHTIIYPEPFPDEDCDYLLDICIDLHFSGTKKLNIVTFANVFFLLEKYSCRRVQCDNLEKAYFKDYMQLHPEKTKDEVELYIKQIRQGKTKN